MTKAEMQEQIRGIFLEGKQSGFKIFAYLRDDNIHFLKRLRITDELRDTIYEKIYNTLEQNYLADGVGAHSINLIEFTEVGLAQLGEVAVVL